ncbi:gamma-glutamyl-gamma-aminobutyrate hydrolase family protein [Streptomyces cucumeris]|uniref:gamma-glutamyl-gamma-aminobutyrate hydrolase family protein n=1 Tax=Streptomyces cucumeris TaxID=2962890 RepID=UPI003D75FE7B
MYNDVRRRPLIAMTAPHDPSSAAAAPHASDSVVRALTTSGSEPVVIGSGAATTALAQLLERADGLLLPGGVGAPDPHPRHFGEEPHPATVINEELDALEFAAVAMAVGLGMPVLGICRGCQVLNVALGGSLVQHLPHSEVNHLQDQPLHTATHRLSLVEGSRLATLHGAHRLKVNSLHHQAVARPAPGLTVAAVAEDGCVEAIEATSSNRWIVGVQYHPEELVDQPPHRLLFDAFVSACAQYAQSRTTVA